MDRYLNEFPIQPPSHQAPPHQPKYQRCKVLPPPQAPSRWHYRPFRSKTVGGPTHNPPQNQGPHQYPGPRPRGRGRQTGGHALRYTPSFTKFTSRYWGKQPPPALNLNTAKSPPPVPTHSTGTNYATLRRPWWIIPEAERTQMHAFTRSSPQLRLKV